MAKGLIELTELSAIGAAIRSKNGERTTYKPSEMAAAILAIPTGGGTPVLESLSVTENGSYTPGVGVDGYNSVSVNVPEGIQGVLTGTTAPSSAQGSDGDLYLRSWPLPSGVHFVEYLESSGTQYIDTGFNTAIGRSLMVRALFERGVTTGLAGGRVGGSGSVYDYGTVVQNFDNSIVLDYGKEAESRVRHKYEISSSAVRDAETGPLKFVDGAFFKGYASMIGNLGTARILLFGYTNGSGRSLYGVRIYRVIIRAGGLILADFLPALDGEGVACMYEVISGTYFYNSGTGSFTAGSTASPAEAPQTVYIKRSGSWMVYNQIAIG